MNLVILNPPFYSSEKSQFAKYLVCSLLGHGVMAGLLGVMPFLFQKNRVIRNLYTFELISIKIPQTSQIESLPKASPHLPKQPEFIKQAPVSAIHVKKKIKKSLVSENKAKLSKVKEAARADSLQDLPILVAEKVSITSSLIEQQFPFYGHIIQAKIKDHWLPPVQFVGMTVVLSFRIHRDGLVDLLTLKRTSGEETLDQIALRTIQLCQPFAPLPPAFPQEYEDFTVFLSVEE